MLRRIAGSFVVLVVLALSAPAARADIDAKLKQYFEIAKVEVFLNGLPEIIATELGKSRSGDSSDTSVEAVQKIAEKHFSSAVLTRDLHKILVRTAEESDIDQSIAFYQSQFGKRVLAYEIAGADPALRETVEAEGKEIFAELTEQGSPRLALFDRFHKATGLDEWSTAFTMNMAYVLLAAIYADPDNPNALSHEQILALINANADKIKADVTASQDAESAYFYRELSDRDLELYVVEMETEGARELSRTVLSALRSVLLVRSRAFGEEYRELLKQRKS